MAIKCKNNFAVLFVNMENWSTLSILSKNFLVANKVGLSLLGMVDLETMISGRKRVHCCQMFIETRSIEEKIYNKNQVTLS